MSNKTIVVVLGCLIFLNKADSQIHKITENDARFVNKRETVGLTKITYFELKDSLADGRWLVYKDVSQKILIIDATYHHKLKAGKYESYYPDGKKEFIGFYKNGKADSTSTHYRPDGKIYEVQRLNLGKYISIAEWSYDTIKKTSTEHVTLFNGAHNVSNINANGKVYFNYYNSTGRLTKRVYSIRYPNDYVIEYYANGNKTKEYHYDVNNQLDGDYTYYDEKGNIIKKLKYNDGVLAH